jgi:hypothetical protein
MSYKLTGTIKAISPKVQVSEKFAKREVVVTDDSSMYPQDILIQMTNDKCDLLNTFEIGQRVEVSFNLRGREWVSPQGETKYFNTIEGWRIEKADVKGSASISEPYVKPDSATTPIQDELPVDDGLPF